VAEVAAWGTGRRSWRDRFRFDRTERRNLLLGLLFISPWLVGFLVFLVYPIYWTLRISFTRYTGFGEPEWIGLDNYREMFKDDLFWTALYNTMYYTVLAVPIGAAVAMILALAMNQPVREVPFYRAIIYLPSVLPVFALSFVWKSFLNPTQGFFNQILINLGLPNINWFGDPAYTKLSLVMLAQFGAGQVALIFLAALKGIPTSLYEAATLDGANAWRRFWGVTLPLMTPVILYDIILGLSLGIQIFGQVFIIFGNDPPGNPADSTLMYVVYLYTNAFRYSEMGYASALAWGLFVLTFVLALAIFKTSRRWVHYDVV
jgi:multiple sugar transport system permease protein